MKARKLLKWFASAMLAAAPTIIKSMFHLEWSDPRLWAMFIFTFGFGATAYAEGLLDGNEK